MNIQKPIKLGDLNNLSLTQKMGLNQKKNTNPKTLWVGLFKKLKFLQPWVWKT